MENNTIENIKENRTENILKDLLETYVLESENDSDITSVEDKKELDYIIPEKYKMLSNCDLSEFNFPLPSLKYWF